MMLLLFLMVSAALAVTARSRRVSARYPYYANLYDIAVAGNERALFLMRAEINKQHTALDARIREEIMSGDIESHVLYRNGQFHLAYPENGYYSSLYRIYANELLTQFLTETFDYVRGNWTLDYTLTASYTNNGGGLADTESSVTDMFHIATTLTTQSDGYIIYSAVDKTVNNETSYPATVEARLVWPTVPHEELFLPAYKWRAAAPDYLRVCLYAGGAILDINNEPVVPDETTAPFELDAPGLIAENMPPPSSFIDTSLCDTLSAYNEPAMIITNAPSFDIASLYERNGDNPVCLLQTSGDSFRLYATDESIKVFNGIVICFGDLILDGVGVTGTAMADGNIFADASMLFTVDEDIVFNISLPLQAEHVLFDFLQLTRFSEAGTGASDNIAYLLNQITFDLANDIDEPSYIKINNFDAASPTMVESKKIAN